MGFHSSTLQHYVGTFWRDRKHFAWDTLHVLGGLGDTNGSG
jgi:hypothetical protein